MRATGGRSESFTALAGALAGAVADIRELATDEMALVKAEAKLEARRLLIRVAMSFLAVMCGLIGVALLAMGLVHGVLQLFPELPIWGAYVASGLVVMLLSWLLVVSAQELRGKEKEEVSSYDRP